MRPFQFVLAFAALFIALSASGGQPGQSSSPTSPDRPTDDADSDLMARLRPMWIPVPKFPPAVHFPPASPAEATPPVPSPAYSEIWQPRWQDELGLSAEQKTKLLAVHTKAMAEVKQETERFRGLSPDERKEQVKRRGGKSSPWRQQLDHDVCTQIETALTPQQLQALRDSTFPAYSIGLLYRAETRQDIGFSAEQEDRLRRTARERMARFQEVYKERARKLWDTLTPQQQAALPEIVKRQGPTSAVLSIAWDLGFELDSLVPAYPLLSEAPVRKQLQLGAEQERQLQAAIAEMTATKALARQGQSSTKTRRSYAASDWESDAKKQVETILTEQQLATLKQLDFRRQVALALADPEKRKTIGISAQQTADFQRLDQDTHDRLYRIDREMLQQALELLTPQQRQQLREEIDRRMHGKPPA